MVVALATVPLRDDMYLYGINQENENINNCRVTDIRARAICHMLIYGWKHESLEKLNGTVVVDQRVSERYMTHSLKLFEMIDLFSVKR